jgi:adenylate cyclase
MVLSSGESTGGRSVVDERRLAAIWAADVVGYSALMEHDEAGTLARLFALRAQVVEPLIAKHDGRVFKTTGDGVLAEFGSAVNAVHAAIAVQSALATRPDREEPLQIRIGIHVGDVLVVEADLFGDGVNLAARLEGAAAPGGIMISEATFAQLSKPIAGEFSEAGELRLKNISRSVRGYRWTHSVEQSPTTLVKGSPALIAVLPFQDLSAELDHGFFADGMVEDLITQLSRSPWFDVIARSSSEAAARSTIDSLEAGRRLGARFVVEGSVRFAGNRVRVNARLVDVAHQHERAFRRRPLRDGALIAPRLPSGSVFLSGGWGSHGPSTFMRKFRCGFGVIEDIDQSRDRVPPVRRRRRWARRGPVGS